MESKLYKKLVDNDAQQRTFYPGDYTTVIIASHHGFEALSISSENYQGLKYFEEFLEKMKKFLPRELN